MKRARPFGLAFVVTALGAAATSAARQEPPRLTLRPADATLSEGFSRVFAIRELADGRLLVSDNGGDSRLVVADLRRDTVREIGVRGDGPGEYRAPGKLYPLAADSTLMPEDARRRRWIILHADSIVVTLPPDDPMILASQGEAISADARGNIAYGPFAGVVAPPPAVRVERRVVVVAGRRSGTRDTVARIRGREERMTVTGTRERPFTILAQAMLSEPDRFAMAPDGWLAIVTQEPYRVTWVGPDRSRVVGPDLHWPRIPVNEREQRAYADRIARASGQPYHASPNADFARVVPPFGGLNAVLHAPDGRVAVRKARWSGAEDTRYDLLDRQGRLVGELRLPETRWLAGFGARSVYVVTRDDDGFERITRHPWP